MSPREVDVVVEPEIVRQVQEELKEKLAVIEEVRADLNAEGITVPGIVVCGDQSAGKSSVLESLTGILFPRSEGTCTRCPAIVSLQPDPHVSKAYAVISTDPDFGDGSIEVPIGEIEEAIKKVTDKLAPGRLISEKPIHIKVVRKDDCTFTIIDLPGITHIAPNGSEQEDIYGVTSSLVRQYIESEDMVILVVIPATSDVQNAEALKLAKTFDPQGRRTLAVLTKVDRVTENDDIKGKMDGKYVSLQLGYMAVRNATHGESYEKAREIEKHLFETHPLLRSLDPGRVGVEALLKCITDMQGKAVAESLPALVKRLRGRILGLRAELQTIPDVLGSHTLRFLKLSTLLTDTSQQLRALIDTAQIRTPEMNLSARGYEFAQEFECGLWEDIPDFLSADMFDLFTDQLKEYRGVTLPDLTGSPIVHQAVRNALEASLPDRSQELTRKLATLVLKATNALIDTHVGKGYPRLAKELQSETEAFVLEQRAQADAFLKSLIEAEVENIQTLNHYYEATISKARTAMRPAPPITRPFGSAAPAAPAAPAAADLSDINPEFLNRAIVASQHGQSNDQYSVCNLQLICHVYTKVVVKAFADTAWKQARIRLCVQLQRDLYGRMMARLGGEGSEDLLQHLMQEDPAVATRRARLSLSLQRFTHHLPKLEKCCRG